MMRNGKLRGACQRSKVAQLFIWGRSSAGRAPALQAGGQRFDPAQLHQGFGVDASWISLSLEK